MTTLTVTNLLDSGAGSLRQACTDAIDGDTIVFAAVLAGGTITFTSQIDLGTKSLTIDALNICTFDVEGKPIPGITLDYLASAVIAANGADCRFFSVSTGTLTIHGLRMTGGGTQLGGTASNTASYRGGCLYCSGAGAIVVADCVVQNSKTFTGGGIYGFDGSTISVTNCTISNCTASSSNGGGIIGRTDSTVNVDGSTFIGCIAAFGGGIFGLKSAITVTGCTFNDCAANNGGGIYGYTRSSISVTNCTISNCTASSSGGGGGFASVDDFSSISVSNSTITGCMATTGSGGVVRSYAGSVVNLVGCTISNCSAPSGGCLFGHYDTVNSVTNCTISGCRTSASGGALYVTNTGALLVYNSKIEGCESSGGDGGACLSFGDGRLELIGCIIDGCTAINGGAISCGGGNGRTYLANSLIKNCASSGTGVNASAVSLSQPNAVVVNCTVVNNSSRRAVFAISGTHVASATINNSVVVGNVSKSTSVGWEWYELNIHYTAHCNTSVFEDGKGDTLFDQYNPQNTTELLEMSSIVDSSTAVQVRDVLKQAWEAGEWNAFPLAGGELIGAGTNALAVDAQGSPLLTDLLGKPRKVGDTIDIGCYEWQPDMPDFWLHPSVAAGVEKTFGPSTGRQRTAIHSLDIAAAEERRIS